MIFRSRTKRVTQLAISFTLLCSVVWAVSADDEPYAGFNIRGSNTLRFDQYESNGPAGTGPYPFEGGQAYNEFGINMNRKDREYAEWRAQFYGVLNANRYRSLDDAFVPERMNLTREVGDSDVPYRWEVGDFFSYFSYLTQQRSIKGLQLEAQPRFGERMDSVVFFAGTNEASWQNLSLSNDASIGLSYLMGETNLGTLSFNVVFNHRDNEFRQGLIERSQTVFSAAFAKQIKLGVHLIDIEAEHGYLTGDHNGRTGLTTASGQDRNGHGSFLEVSGRHTALPFDYRFRGERYEDDFQPRGGVITPDRRSAEGHFGWRFANGLRLRGRLQAFDTSFQSANELETRTIGVNLAGPMFTTWIDNATGNADFYIQSREDEAGNVDQELINFTASLNTPLIGGWNGRLGTFIQDLNNDVGVDAATWQISAQVDHAITLGRFSGQITPGMLVRLLRQGAPESDEFEPTLNLRLGDNAHSIGFNYGVLVQDRLFTAVAAQIIDIDTHRMSVDYRYRMKRHEFGSEFSYFDRNPDPGIGTEAWNLAVYWTYQFDRPAAENTYARRAKPSAAPIARSYIQADLFALQPGMKAADAVGMLGAAGVTGSSQQAGYRVYETQVFPELFQRQRLVLGSDGDRVTVSAVLISLVALGSGDNIEQSFERVRKALIDRYGSPVVNFEEGSFTQDIINDVNSQRLIRVIEWETDSGFIRLGIPRRRDGQVRIEVQHRPSFPQPRDTLWSIEAVR